MTAISRRPDWRARLGAYIETVRRAPFTYGTLDCALFAAGAVAAMTGEDLAAELRGTYESFPAGLYALRRQGFMDPIDMVRSHFPEVPVALAQVGDIAVVQLDEGPALGILQGARIFLMGLEGLVTADLLAARAAFRV